MRATDSRAVGGEIGGSQRTGKATEAKHRHRHRRSALTHEIVCSAKAQRAAIRGLAAVDPGKIAPRHIVKVLELPAKNNATVLWLHQHRLDIRVCAKAQVNCWIHRPISREPRGTAASKAVDLGEATTQHQSAIRLNDHIIHIIVRRSDERGVHRSVGGKAGDVLMQRAPRRRELAHHHEIGPVLQAQPEHRPIQPATNPDICSKNRIHCPSRSQLGQPRTAYTIHAAKVTADEDAAIREQQHRTNGIIRSTARQEGWISRTISQEPRNEHVARTSD